MPITENRNLENLKKRAKQLVRWHRDGDHIVAPRLRAAVARFSDLSDAEILAAHLALSEAQDVIAKERGFPNWLALKTGVKIMPETGAMNLDGDKSGPAPMLYNAYPQLFVSDIDRTCDFFERVLGFRTAFKFGAPPGYAQIMRDGARLSVRCVTPSPIDMSRVEAGELLAAYIVVENVKRLFVEVKEAGGDFFQTLMRQPYDVDDFIVRDPDGNLLAFASPPR